MLLDKCQCLPPEMRWMVGAKATQLQSRRTKCTRAIILYLGKPNTQKPTYHSLWWENPINQKNLTIDHQKQPRSYKLALTQPCCFRIVQPSFQMLELHCALLTVLHHPISCCRPLSAAGVIKTGSVCNLRCPWTRFFNQLGWIVFMFPWDFGRSMRLDSWTEGLQTGSKKLHLSPFSPQVFTQRSKNQNLRFLATGW